ncbi:MAG: PmoA family protein [Caldilineaceae bacterium]
MVAITHHEHQLSLARSVGRSPLLVQRAAPTQRPYIHPLLAPDEQGVLTEDVPPHHPWQHGLYIGYNDVNGFGFWTEGLRGSANDGTFHPRPLLPPNITGDQVHWSVETELRAPNSTTLLIEQQRWSFQDKDDCYLLQLDLELRAQTHLTFGRYDYGGLFLRMPFRPSVGGEAINSEGQVNGAAEQQRARWVAVSMPLIDRSEEWAGVAMLDHPTNQHHPTVWRVDNQLGIGPSPSSSGSWQLQQGESILFRYGLFVFCGRTESERIEEAWQRYTSS